MLKTTKYLASDIKPKIKKYGIIENIYTIISFLYIDICSYMAFNAYSAL